MKPGDKVVCVDDSLHPIACEFDFPCGYVVKNTVYVIRGMIPDRTLERDGYEIFIIGPKTIWRKSGVEYGWNYRRFRLLDELKQEAKQRQSQPQLT